MICANCDSEVVWKGPADNMYRVCIGCGIVDGDIIDEAAGYDSCDECGIDLGPNDAEGICQQCDFMLYAAQES